MAILESFDHFNPLTQPIKPDTPHTFQLEMVATRARELLAGRTEQQIRDALDTLDWILVEGRALIEQAAIEALTEESDRDIYVMTDTRALKHYMPEFDIGDQSRLPNATWADYFAILALAHIGAALDESGDDLLRETVSSLGVAPETITLQRESLKLDYLLEATEAVATAEFLAEKQTAHQRKSRKGGARRASKYNELKSFVFSKWEASFQHLSNRQAAKKIWPLVPDQLKALLTTDAPETRLEGWIGKSKKSQSQNV